MDNLLEIVEGNSAIIDITPLDETTGQPIRLGVGDKVIFTVKTLFGKMKLQKVLTSQDYDSVEDDSLNCVLEPPDTIGWDSGDYLYDCLLMTSDNMVITFISSTFRIVRALGKYTDVG